MAQSDILHWFYIKYLEAPNQYYTIKDVAKALNMGYPSALKQMKRLAFFDWLQTAKPQSLFSNGTEKHLFKLHYTKRNRCKLMFCDIKMVNSYQSRATNDIYLSDNTFKEEKSADIEVYNGL